MINKLKQQYEVILYIGSDNRTNKINTAYINQCLNITSSYYEGFNIESITGVYKGLKEDSIKLTIFTDNIKHIKVLCNDLKTALKQESILYTINKADYNLI